MANLDSANKRRSATGVFGLYTIPPVPDGTIAALDREQATYVYAGISPGSAPVSAWTNITIKGINALTGEYVYIVGQYK